jgi:hypothetical protein
MKTPPQFNATWIKLPVQAEPQVRQTKMTTNLRAIKTEVGIVLATPKAEANTIATNPVTGVSLEVVKAEIAKVKAKVSSTAKASQIETPTLKPKPKLKLKPRPTPLLSVMIADRHSLTKKGQKDHVVFTNRANATTQIANLLM